MLLYGNSNSGSNSNGNGNARGKLGSVVLIGLTRSIGGVFLYHISCYFKIRIRIRIDQLWVPFNSVTNVSNSYSMPNLRENALFRINSEPERCCKVALVMILTNGTQFAYTWSLDRTSGLPGRIWEPLTSVIVC